MVDLFENSGPTLATLILANKEFVNEKGYLPIRVVDLPHQQWEAHGIEPSTAAQKKSTLSRPRSARRNEVLT